MYARVYHSKQHSRKNGSHRLESCHHSNMRQRFLVPTTTTTTRDLLRVIIKVLNYSTPDMFFLSGGGGLHCNSG